QRAGRLEVQASQKSQLLLNLCLMTPRLQGYGVKNAFGQPLHKLLALLLRDIGIRLLNVNTEGFVRGKGNCPAYSNRSLLEFHFLFSVACRSRRSLDHCLNTALRIDDGDGSLQVWHAPWRISAPGSAFIASFNLSLSGRESVTITRPARRTSCEFFILCLYQKGAEAQYPIPRKTPVLGTTRI